MEDWIGGEKKREKREVHSPGTPPNSQLIERGKMTAIIPLLPISTQLHHLRDDDKNCQITSTFMLQTVGTKHITYK